MAKFKEFDGEKKFSNGKKDKSKTLEMKKRRQAKQSSRFND